MPKSRRKPSGTAITSYARDITLANKAPATHAAQHAKDGSAPITPESIGAAPAGFGLGETPKRIADANDAVKNGVYAISRSTLNLPGPDMDMWEYTYLKVDVGDRPDAYIKQTKTSPYQGWQQCDVTRCFYDQRGGWQPWEWMNPPTLLGVEYRTTERYLGKPVYVKVVDCGNLPNTTSKEVAHGIANVAYMIDVTLQGLNASSFTHNANELTVWANYECVYIKTLNDLSRYSVYASLRYTKTTD